MTAIALACAPGVASANLLVNGDFETGTLAPFLGFVTPFGTAVPGAQLAPSTIGTFDVSGNGASKAVRLNVGRTHLVESSQGAGIGTFFTVPTAGTIDVSAKVAVGFFPANPGLALNAQGGEFRLDVNGVLLDMVDAGAVGRNTVERYTLSGSIAVGAGKNALNLFVRRPLLADAELFQYIDDLVVTLRTPGTGSGGTPVPEPGTLVLLGAGLLGLATARRRRAPSVRV